MTVTLDLKPEIEARLQAQAAARGLPMQAYVLSLIEQITDMRKSHDPTLVLFAQWEAEDATDDPDELVARNRDWMEMEANLKANRVTLRASRGMIASSGEGLPRRPLTPKLQR